MESIGTSPAVHLFLSQLILFVAAFPLQWQLWVAVVDTRWLGESLKKFPMRPFACLRIQSFWATPLCFLHSAGSGCPGEPCRTQSLMRGLPPSPGGLVRSMVVRLLQLRLQMEDKKNHKVWKGGRCQLGGGLGRMLPDQLPMWPQHLNLPSFTS